MNKSITEMIAASHLFHLSELVLVAFPGKFVEIAPHDTSDPENPDMLWLEKDDSPFCEGLVLAISRDDLSEDDQSCWDCSLSDANTVGGWVLRWSFGGNTTDALNAISKLLS